MRHICAHFCENPYPPNPSNAASSAHLQDISRKAHVLSLSKPRHCCALSLTDNSVGGTDVGLRRISGQRVRRNDDSSVSRSTAHLCYYFRPHVFPHRIFTFNSSHRRHSVHVILVQRNASAPDCGLRTESIVNKQEPRYAPVPKRRKGSARVPCISPNTPGDSAIGSALRSPMRSMQADC